MHIYKILITFIIIFLIIFSLSFPSLAIDASSYVWSSTIDDSLLANSDLSSQNSNTETNNTDENNSLNLECGSAILIEQKTGQILYSHNIHEQLRPASVTKVMSILLIMEAISNQKISLTDSVPCSENAASMGGSQIWLDPRETLSVDDMLKAICVNSANDCVVAMSEFIAGSEEAFVQMMNDKAKELGMNDTCFKNCHGLDQDGHITSSYDISLMSRELLNKYPEVTKYTTIWMDSLRDGKSQLSNTNKLLRHYQGATGLKTGSTSKAGFCLSATAERNHISLIAVVMACQSAKERVKDCASLLDYGFSLCKIYTDKQPPALSTVPVHNGTKEFISCKYKKNFSYVFTSEINQNNIQKKVVFQKNLSAPIKKNQIIGRLEYSYNNKKIGKVSILASETVGKAKYTDYLQKLLLNL